MSLVESESHGEDPRYLPDPGTWDLGSPGEGPRYLPYPGKCIDTVSLINTVMSSITDVSTAHSEQFEEFKSVFDAQQRLDGMQLEEDDDGEECEDTIDYGIQYINNYSPGRDDCNGRGFYWSCLEVVDLTYRTPLLTIYSISIASTGYTGSATMEYSSMEDLTDELNSIYSDNEKSELEVECENRKLTWEYRTLFISGPTYFYVSSEGKAVAMDSIEALDKLADFMPIPVGKQNIPTIATGIELTDDGW